MQDNNNNNNKWRGNPKYEWENKSQNIKIEEKIFCISNLGKIINGR